MAGFLRRLILSSEALPQSLEARISAIETDVRLIKVEWQSVLDKVLQRMDRSRKRDKAALMDTPAEADVDDLKDEVAIMRRARQQGLTK